MRISQIIPYLGALGLLSFYAGLPVLGVWLVVLMLGSALVSWLITVFKKERKWSSPKFLNKVFPLIEEELDWDSMWGMLDANVSQAKTYSGETVIVAVLDDLSYLSEALADAEEQKHHADLPDETPLWLYLPEELISQVTAPDMNKIVLKPV